jgi:hypothetical protein
VYRAYAGTAKGLSNLSTVLWNKSSKISPILQCPDCRRYNIPYLDNIYEDFLRCKYCKGRLSVRHPYITFKALGKLDAKITGFWIPQLSLPLHVENPDKWSELWRKYNEYPREQFLNEVLGVPAGNGIFMITEQDLATACQPGFQMWDEFKNIKGMVGPQLCLYAGVDWAVTNEEGKSFTVLTIGGFNAKTNRFTVVYIKKYMEPDPLEVINHIAQTCIKFQVRKIIGDWGVGHVANPLLAKRSGIKVFPLMYAGDKTLINWDAKKKFYQASRTRTLLDLFKQIKHRRIHFFRWEEFQYFKSHFLAEFAEYKKDRFGNESLRFDHPPDEPDDCLHSLNIMFAVFKRDFDRNSKIFP